MWFLFLANVPALLQNLQLSNVRMLQNASAAFGNSAALDRIEIGLCKL
jgi:hypothetical protein